MYRSIRFIALLLVVMTTAFVASAQVGFKIPITVNVSTGTHGADVLYVGVHDGNNYAQDLSTTFGAAGEWKETANPPDPIEFDYISKFTDFRTPKTWAIQTGLKPYDIRGFVAATQIDTYQINVYGDGVSSLVGAGTVSFSWDPAYVALCTDVVGGSCILVKSGVVLADMRVASSVVDLNEGTSNNIKYYVVKTGAVQPPQYKLIVSPITIPATPRGSSVAVPVTMTNVGVGPGNLTGTVAVTGAAFACSITSLDLAPNGGSVSGTVTFTAPAPGGTTETGSLVITCLDPASPITIPLSGVSLGPCAAVLPTSLAFGTVQYPAPSSQNIVISNACLVPLTISSITVAGADAAYFSALPASGVVAPGGSLTVAVTFATNALDPATPIDGEKSASIVIASDAYNAPSLSVPVTGTVQTQGGILVIGDGTGAMTVLDASKSDEGYYASPIVMLGYAGNPFSGFQATLVTQRGINVHKITAAALVDNDCWELTVNPVRGPKLADGTSIDTFYILLHANSPECALTAAQVAGQTLLNMRFDVANIEGHTATSGMSLIDIKSAQANADDAKLNASFDLVITINNRTLKGDVNQDDHVDILDILAIVDHIVNKKLLTGEAFTDADIYPWSAGDGEVTIQDLTLLQNIILSGVYPSGQKIEESLDGLNKADAATKGTITFHITKNGISVVLDTRVDFRGAQMDFRNVTTAPTSVISTEMADVNAMLRDDNSLRLVIFDQKSKVLPAGTYLLADMPMQNFQDYYNVQVSNLTIGNANCERESYNVVVTDQPTNLLPSKNRLAQNFPNPFNPATKIMFDVEQSGQVRIVVYNLLGQEIATLLDKYMDRGRDKSVTWNGKDAAGHTVATGTYIYRMQAGNFVETKKMMFLK